MFCIFITFFMANIDFLVTGMHPKIYLKYFHVFFLHISGMLLIFWLSLFIKRISYSSPSVTSISWSNPINICYIFDCLQMAKQTTKQKYLHPKCIQLEISMLWCSKEIWNPTIYNMIRWFAGPMWQTIRRPSVWRSKYFFIISYRLRALKTHYFSFL